MSFLQHLSTSLSGHSRQHFKLCWCAGDPPPEKEIGAETSDEEDAPVTCNDESFAAVAAVRVGY